eukprot:2654070-Pyramimonas_sp.AAC.2
MESADWWIARTFTVSCRKHSLPTNSSISCRAARPNAFSAAPPFPMMIPFCVSLSTMISALMKSLLSLSSYATTLTVEA